MGEVTEPSDNKMRPRQTGPSREDDHPFKRLASVTKRLLAVPKGEVEEKAEQEREAREAHKPK